MLTILDAFETVVRRYWTVGITEFIFYYPERDEQIPLFEHIVRRVIPKLRMRAHYFVQ